MSSESYKISIALLQATFPVSLLVQPSVSPSNHTSLLLRHEAPKGVEGVDIPYLPTSPAQSSKAFPCPEGLRRVNLRQPS